MNTFISFVVVLGLLVFVHEFGHFIWAKLFGVRVLKFSLGFGPKLAGKKYGDTEYLVSAFPLGGYVKMFGEGPDDEVDPAEKAYTFYFKPVWQRFIIVLGGPLFNILLSVVLFFLVFAISGMPQPVDTTKIGGVGEESPAEKAGLKVDDVILTINGEETKSWETVAELIANSGGEQITLTVSRGNEILEINAQPALDKTKNIFGEELEERFMLGIMRASDFVVEDVSIGKALSASFVQTWNFMYLTSVGIVKIIQKVIPAKELGGPILIAQMTGQSMREGWINLFYFIGLLSVNLGILNLLPIPILDGGHLLFFTIEAVMRKPLNTRIMEVMQQVGLVLLGSLMIFVFYNDLVRLFG